MVSGTGTSVVDPLGPLDPVGWRVDLPESGMFKESPTDAQLEWDLGSLEARPTP